jgi:hypothetical protein
MESKEYYKKLFPLLTDYELMPNRDNLIESVMS